MSCANTVSFACILTLSMSRIHLKVMCHLSDTTLHHSAFSCAACFSTSSGKQHKYSWKVSSTDAPTEQKCAHSPLQSEDLFVVAQAIMLLCKKGVSQFHTEVARKVSPPWPRQG